MSVLFEEPAFVRRPVGVVRVTGVERLAFLHTLLSQHLEQAVAGQAADFLYLDEKGNPIAAGRALVRADDVLLVVAPELAEALTQKLDGMRFMMRVEVADDSAAWAMVSVRGQGVQAAGAPMTFSESAGGLQIHDRSGGIDLLGPADWLAEQVAQLALPEASAADWQVWRISQGEAAWGSEISAGHRAQELGLLPTHVHLRKGCYPGQESIAKTWNLGRPRRALAVVQLDAEPGAQVQIGESAAPVTSAAPTDDGWLALVLVPAAADGTIPAQIDQPAGRILKKVGEGLPIPGS